MFCSNCGAKLSDGVKFCESCGHPVAQQADTPKPEQPIFIPIPPKDGEQTKAEPPKVDEPIFEPDPDPVVPEENRPLGPWAYFGYGLLFLIPVVGFVLLIVFSFAGKNVNRKNFARSYWCWAILCLALILIFVVVLLTGLLRGVTTGLAVWLNSIGLSWLAGLIG